MDIERKREMDSYVRWMEQEREWITQAESERKASLPRFCVLCVLACMIFLGVIGLLVGGGIMGMLQNMLSGIIFGAVASLITTGLMLLLLPSKAFMDRLKMVTEKKLTPVEREELASQMLSPDVRCVEYKEEDKRRVRISRDYMLLTTSGGIFTLIKLGNLYRLQKDSGTLPFNIFNFKIRDSRLTNLNKYYTIGFYYQDADSGEVKAQGELCTFESSEVRDLVMQHIREMADYQKGGEGL